MTVKGTHESDLHSHNIMLPRDSQLSPKNKHERREPEDEARDGLMNNCSPCPMLSLSMTSDCNTHPQSSHNLVLMVIDGELVLGTRLHVL